jgi:hypothetical protein
MFYIVSGVVFAAFSLHHIFAPENVEHHQFWLQGVLVPLAFVWGAFRRPRVETIPLLLMSGIATLLLNDWFFGFSKVVYIVALALSGLTALSGVAVGRQVPLEGKKLLMWGLLVLAVALSTFGLVPLVRAAFN